MRKLLVKFQDNWKIGCTWLTYSKADNKMFFDICKRHNVTSRNVITKNTGSQSTLSVFVTGSSNMKLEHIMVLYTMKSLLPMYNYYTLELKLTLIS